MYELMPAACFPAAAFTIWCSLISHGDKYYVTISIIIIIIIVIISSSRMIMTMVMIIGLIMTLIMNVIVSIDIVTCHYY